jgi:hypothetical protein
MCEVNVKHQVGGDGMSSEGLLWNTGKEREEERQHSYYNKHYCPIVS